MLSIIGIKKTIKQHTADMDITDSVDYKISAPPRFYNTSTMSVIYNPYRPNTVIYYIYSRIEIFNGKITISHLSYFIDIFWYI
jgi:hypothetical protein